jgi:hypothetical protein
MKLLLSVLLATALSAQSSDPWKPFEFLMGDWVGEGGGGPGQGSGGFSFSFDLNRNVLVRKNFSEYPAQNGQPASRHEDLMIVYLENKKPRAIYFDTEGHTIRYAVTSSANSLVFESEPGEPGPHYRLSYAPDGNRVKGKFEMRAPGEAQYKTYLDFAVRKKN